MVAHITWISLVLLVGSLIIEGNGEPMARPMPPKVFNSAEDLRKYLELIKDYYNLNGKARYGKRSTETLLTSGNYNNPSDTLRMILNQGRDNRRDMEMENDLSMRLETNRPQIQNRMQRLSSYPYSFLSKYYRNIQ
ncbi:uncharacterized protein LOC122510273 [Leptopilina heterotoma]|uniref:uncharacterized protein LOC122510273 n=1 Tax=Leptopilina heterotoma TaxID=63436 RepID=UPI001CA93F05|nr:uncharacterized protein LOC122510273 [Leptopilina heterotoma]XP_043480718.1 uncharacterized protein LOC122510273 [Leptopilina heterotoma]XP_043480719.1 uncharacterized protein LOC122510273 [Leptopilina heterotoma]XP_043480720.1 uncharacterized protein LOC122510273 [Leptopilina heterotoma]XP_043480721.1 uncharacterized protein LOC122510273 [Leptopilina heterotoma]XP_043480722.1 uncharacterized protein LOC122510273 [Leptopilina heterotoma]XP_043480724.1 uncharacterized protein LOC122510273 [